MEYVYNLDNINKASKLVIDNIKTTVVRIDGKMGAGKTKIISNICMQLGVKEVITSPTFSLINTYKSSNGPIHHFDFILYVFRFLFFYLPYIMTLEFGLDIQ